MPWRLSIPRQRTPIKSIRSETRQVGMRRGSSACRLKVPHPNARLRGSAAALTTVLLDTQAPRHSAAQTSRNCQQYYHALEGTNDSEVSPPHEERRSTDNSANAKARALSRCQMKCVPTLQDPQKGVSSIRKNKAAEKIVPAATSSRGTAPRLESGTAKATPKVAINLAHRLPNFPAAASR